MSAFTRDGQLIPDEMLDERDELREEIESLEAKIERLRHALDLHAKWEGDIIMDSDCWKGELPHLTQPLWDRVTEELQPARAAALGAARLPS